MTKLISRYFFRGLITALPLGLTVYFLYLLLVWSETMAFHLLQPLIGDVYIPGMGLLLSVLGILVLGFLVSQRSVRKLLVLVELPFTNLPVVKSIYSSLKDFAAYFAPRRDKAAQQTVVVLRMPGGELEMVGLITRQQIDDLPDGFQAGDRVAVYLPMGYNIGGYTVFVPRDWVQPIEMSVEEAMRASLFAWMNSAGPKTPPVSRTL